jgi:GNAT superfamily N-acetyltransferase
VSYAVDNLQLTSADIGARAQEDRKQEDRKAVYDFHPVTPERLVDLERYSLAHGRFRYCSCMRWRLASADYKRSTKEGRIAALDALVQHETPVGVLAYQDGEPVGWVSVAPRETYAALERYKALPRVDDSPAWSVVCFFVDSHERGQGLTLDLLRAAVAYAVSQGAQIVEGYPVEPDARLYTYMGSVATFRAAGFQEVAQGAEGRPIMRYYAERDRG